MFNILSNLEIFQFKILLKYLLFLTFCSILLHFDGIFWVHVKIVDFIGKTGRIGLPVTSF